jgi:antibiotic biosynthesis monooxygenase (ABM) superfamily enzyme
MPKVILQISYDIDPDHREEYLALLKELKSHFRQVRKKNYTVFEQKGKKNSFVEEFVCNSVEEYDALEDDLDEKSEELVNQLEAFLRDGRAKYTTLREIE